MTLGLLIIENAFRFCGGEPFTHYTLQKSILSWYYLFVVVGGGAMKLVMTALISSVQPQREEPCTQVLSSLFTSKVCDAKF